jgi:exonuclease III
MKIISWNIRGLNGHSKKKFLRDLILAKKLDIMMLQETKCATKDMDKLLPYYWKQGKAVSTTATGTVGGLYLLWNPNTIIMENFITTKWSISATYRPIGSNKPSYLSNFYGPASSRDKRALLHNLEYLYTLTKERGWI